MPVLGQGFGVKSRQSGVTTTTASSGSVSINAVDTSKSIIIQQSVNGSFFLDLSGTGGHSRQAVEGRFELSSSTQITYYRASWGISNEPIIYWQVIEFN